ncbi:hypothetical protein FACS189459_1030 [Bacilli bacterium]|nr:hypothetical protein FACS189459_1030 [Bacilli bacterium]
MYEHMANDAKAEGYDYVAELFLGIAAIEKNHQQRYESYLNLINSKNMFTSSSDGTVWFCTNCGHLHTAKNAPKVCPICSHPQDYFVKSTLKVTE